MATELTIHVRDREVLVAANARDRQLSEQRSLIDTSIRLTPEELASTIQDAANQRSATATLVLPSSWCYVHAISAPRRRPNHMALIYALEELLPVEAEQLTCGFLRTTGEERIGIAVETSRVRPLLDRLARHGLYIDDITIDVLACAQSEDSAARVAWCDVEHIAVLDLAAGLPQSLRIVRLAPGLDEDEWQTRRLRMSWIPRQAPLTEHDVLSAGACHWSHCGTRSRGVVISTRLVHSVNPARQE